MRLKESAEPSQNMVQYANKHIQSAQRDQSYAAHLEPFIAHLLKFPGLRTNQNNPWFVIQFLFSQLSKSDQPTKERYSALLTPLVNYYIHQCETNTDQYHALTNATRYTASLIFKLNSSIALTSAVKIPAHFINSLLDEIADQADEALPIALCKSILGASYLAERNNLDGQIDAFVTSEILKALSDQAKAANTVDLSKSLFAISNLAHYNCLQGKIDDEAVSSVFRALISETSRTSPASLPNTLSSVLSLTNNNLVQGKISANYINVLLIKIANHMAVIKATAIQQCLIDSINLAINNLLLDQIDLSHIVQILTTLMTNSDSTTGNIQTELLSNKITILTRLGGFRSITSTTFLPDMLQAILDNQTSTDPHYLTIALLAASYAPKTESQQQALLTVIDLLTDTMQPQCAITGLYGLMQCIAQNILTSDQPKIQTCFLHLQTLANKHYSQQQQASLDETTLSILTTSNAFYRFHWDKKFRCEQPLYHTLCSRSQAPKSSHMQQDISSSLQEKLPFYVTTRNKLYLGDFLIDTSVEYGDIKLAIEIVDQHREYDNRLIRNYFLSKAGWTIIPICYTEWVNKTPAAKDSLIEEKILQRLPNLQQHITLLCTISALKSKQVSPENANNPPTTTTSPSKSKPKRRRKKKSNAKLNDLDEQPSNLSPPSPRFFKQPAITKNQDKHSSSCQRVTDYILSCCRMK